ncbi:unnamed protein product [Meloidogyne enterolobii]|uniref:Uncharacterized protein n=1 Tax=Meloidogyne enterolobii TaxID=390850 RepID=A0ACB0XLP2_MELEN
MITSTQTKNHKIKNNLFKITKFFTDISDSIIFVLQKFQNFYSFISKIIVKNVNFSLKNRHFCKFFDYNFKNIFSKILKLKRHLAQLLRNICTKFHQSKVPLFASFSSARPNFSAAKHPKLLLRDCCCF